MVSTSMLSKNVSDAALEADHISMQAALPAHIIAAQAAPVADTAGLPLALKNCPNQESRTEIPKRLTPEQRHYLVYALVSLQIAREMDDLMRPGQLALYGPPFASKAVFSPSLAAENGFDLLGGQRDPGPEPCIFRFIFHSSIKIFPFLSSVPENFWQKRVQALADDLAARQMSSPHERGAGTLLRLRLLMATRLGAYFFSRGVGIADSDDETYRDDNTDQSVSRSPWRAGVKRNLARPAQLPPDLQTRIENLFPSNSGNHGEAWKRAGDYTRQRARDWRSFWVQCIEEPDGMRKAWSFLSIPRIADLPPDKLNVIRTVRDGLGGLIRQLLLCEPESDLMFRSLKNGASSFPFWAVKQVLRSSSAAGIVQGLISILLARPAGTQSVIQRIVRRNFSNELNLCERMRVAPVAQSIHPEYATYATRVQAYVRSSTPAQREAVSAKARQVGDDILTVILLEGSTDVKILPEDRLRVRRMQASFARSQYIGHLDSASPIASDRTKKESAQLYQKAQSVSGQPLDRLSPRQEREALVFARLKLLLRETFYTRDLQNAKNAMRGGLVPGLLKDLLDALLPVFAMASKQAHLADRLSDVQSFLDDLIKTRELNDPSPEVWSALIARHEQNLWTLLHELSCIPEISEQLLDWCQRGCTFMATSEAPPEGRVPVSANVHGPNHDGSGYYSTKQPKVEVNCDALLDTLDPSAQAAVRKELDMLVSWRIWGHAREELLARRGVLLAHDSCQPPAGLGKNCIPPGLAAEVHDVDRLMLRLMGDPQVETADTMGAASSQSFTTTRPDTGVCACPARGTETQWDPDNWFDSLDPCGQHLLSEGPSRTQLRYFPTRTNATPPALLHTRTLLLAFIDAIRKGMPRYN